MTVSGCVIAGSKMSAEDARGRFSQTEGSTHPLAQLRAMAALCNAAEFDVATAEAPLSERRIFGDATDQAIVRFAEFVDTGSVPYLRACWRKTYELAFNSKNKFMVRCFSIAKPEAIPTVLSKGSLFEPTDM
jgi:sodium/potassium-transporting ATPase subunit alpha